jgi:NitT/TauT family transport system substrate-binding protein
VTVKRSARWGSAVATASLALVLAACNSAATTAGGGTGSGAPQSANPVTLNAIMPNNILYAPFYLGIEQGIFLKHGIDLKIDSVSSGNQAIQALQANKDQFAATSWPSMVPAVVQGVPLQVFGIVTGSPTAASYDDDLAITLRPGVHATGVAGLKGLKIATQFGGGSDAWCRATLSAAGLNPSTDVKLVNAKSADFLALLQSKAADASCSVEPYPSLDLARLPGSTVLVRGGGVSEARIVVDATSAWLKANAGVAAQVVAALLESQQYLRQNFDAAVKSTSDYVSNVDASINGEGMKHVDYDGRWSATIQQSFDNATQQLVSAGTIKSAPPTASMLDLDLLNGIQTNDAQYLTDLSGSSAAPSEPASASPAG